MVQIGIPCAHETGEVKDTSQRANDYHSLSREDIVELLKLAAQHSEDEDKLIVNRVQVRLHQGIPGMVCPRPYEGKIADQMRAMDNFYVKHYRLGAKKWVVDRLYKILYG